MQRARLIDKIHVLWSMFPLYYNMSNPSVMLLHKTLLLPSVYYFSKGPISCWRTPLKKVLGPNKVESRACLAMINTSSKQVPDNHLILNTQVA